MPKRRTSTDRLKRFWYWAKRTIVSLGCFLFVFVAFVFIRFDIPNEAALFKRTRDSSALAWLDGNYVVTQDMQAGESEGPIVIGHRGWGSKQEIDGKETVIGNTETAIRRAVEEGIKWIEIDVRITGVNEQLERELVLFHDEKLGPKVDCKGNKEWEKKAVSDFEWNELQKLNLKVSPPESLFLLDEALEKFKDDDITWVIDIKPENAEEDLDTVKRDLLLGVLENLDPKRVILFGPPAVLKLYREKLDSASGFDFGFMMLKTENMWGFLFHRNGILKQCKELEAKYLVLPGMFAETSFLRNARQLGIQVLVWDCENLVDQQNFVARGAKGLIVDSPATTKNRFSGSD